MTRESGNASVAVIAAVAMVMVMLAGLADVTLFMLGRAKAQTAADAAALAAAAELIPGRGRDPVGVARTFAARNGARLVRCDCPLGGSEASVRVVVPLRFLSVAGLGVSSVTARAKAGIDLSIRKKRSY